MTHSLFIRDFPPAGDDITVEPDWEDEDSVISELTCLGIVGIQDNVRPEVCSWSHIKYVTRELQHELQYHVYMHEADVMDSCHVFLLYCVGAGVY